MNKFVFIAFIQYLALGQAHPQHANDPAADESKKCAIPSRNRIMCGQPGLSEDQCLSNDCCFDRNAQNGENCFHTRCSIPGEMRKDCGHVGISQEECHAKGCCFNDDTIGVPWCFYDASTERQSLEQCAIAQENRVNCGEPGISAQECNDMGCCYSADKTNAPSCFHQSCSIPGDFREDCGHPGITIDECHAQGCCYNSDTVGVPWCFYDTSMYQNTLKVCDINPEHRITCGEPGIKEPECNAKGCCYRADEQNPGAAACFHERCSVPGEMRDDCGFPGITMEQCHAKGCCYNSDEIGFPWCFKAPSSNSNFLG